MADFMRLFAGKSESQSSITALPEKKPAVDVVKLGMLRKQGA